MIDKVRLVHNGSVTDSKGFRWVYDVLLGDFIIQHSLESEVAKQFVSEWNDAHDTLKAKEELLELAASIIGRLVSDLCRDCILCDSKDASKTACKFSIVDARDFLDKV